MKLKAIDQLHVSSVKPDSLRPGEEFEVSDAAGKELLKTGKVARVETVDAAAAKSEPAPENKAEKPPANKAGARNPAAK